MSRAGMINTGQPAREAYGENQVFLTGFTTYQGTVIAGDEWGSPMKKWPFPKPALRVWKLLCIKKAPETDTCSWKKKKRKSVRGGFRTEPSELFVILTGRSMEIIFRLFRQKDMMRLSL